MNVFEGTRRIVYVLAFLWVGLAIYSVSETDHAPTYRYQMTWPGEKPQVHSGECLYPNQEETRDLRKDGTVDAHISLCFLAQRASNGQMLIPYTKVADHEYFMMAPFSDAVNKYTKETMTAVMSAGAFNRDVSGIPWKRYANASWAAAKLVFGGLIALYFITRLMGWIVRGFMGIPAGQDQRPRT